MKTAIESNIDWALTSCEESARQAFGNGSYAALLDELQFLAYLVDRFFVVEKVVADDLALRASRLGLFQRIDAIGFRLCDWTKIESENDNPRETLRQMFVRVRRTLPALQA